MRYLIRRALLAALALTLLLGAHALADAPNSDNYGIYLPQLTFVETHFWGGQSFPLHTGPGTNYPRMARGYAKALSDDTIYAAGWEGDWLLILYPTKTRERVGYISADKISEGRKGVWDGAAKRTLTLANIPGVITRDCELTDDPSSLNNPLTYCAEGLTVTLLATYSNGLKWTYVETVLDGKAVRAFVPYDCVTAY